MMKTKRLSNYINGQIVAQMIGNGTNAKRSVYPPEQIVSGGLYIKEMRKRGINMEESVEH